MKPIRSCFSVPACLAVLCLSLSASAQNGYQIGEGSNAGPVRMARVSDLVGTAEMRPSDNVSWGVAAMNTPLRQGAEIWAKSGSRTEVQFDDGSVMRLGGDGVAVLENLYSDSNGEFTELKLENGLMTLHLRSKLSEYQVDTPQCAVKAYGPAIVRVGVNGSSCEAVVESGQAEIDNGGGSRTLTAGQRVDLGGAGGGGNGSRVEAAFAVRSAPRHDDWDNWSYARDRKVFYENRYVPSDVNITAGNLDDYGSWHDDPRYGEVWSPSEPADWQPYEEGNWDWVSPFGWTWCGDEPWGWAPYHYGTWYRASWGWSWDPGPVNQYWSPAVVDYCDYGSNVAWAPLAPWEVRYPAAIDIGFSSGNWAIDFSIGQAACWFPSSGDYCEPRPWANVYANSGWGYYDPTYINNYYSTTIDYSNGIYGASTFRPYNAYQVNGAVFASRDAFANGGRFDPLPRTRAATFFERGQSFRSAPRGSQISGPLMVRPTQRSFVPTHRVVNTAPPATIASRPVFRGRVASNIAQHSVSFSRNRVAGVMPNNRMPNNRMAMPNNGVANRMNMPNNRMANPAMRNNPANGRFAQHMNQRNAAGPGRNMPANAANNRYARFNNVSHSPFTSAQRTVTRNALRNGNNRSAMAAQHNANVAASHRANMAAHYANSVRNNVRATGTGRTNVVAHNANAARRAAFNQARPARNVNRARTNINRTSPSFTRSRPSVTRTRPSFNRPNRTISRPSFSRPNRTISRPSFSRPNRTYSRPSFSRPSVNRPSFSRPSFSRPVSRPSFSRPSFSRPVSRPSFSRPSFSRPTVSRPSVSRPSVTRPSAPRSRPSTPRRRGGG